MSTTYATVKQRAFPVRLDTLTLYASSWRLHGERVLTEQNGLINVSYVTSSANRSKRITLEGHFCFTDNPASIIQTLDRSIRDNTRYIFELRGMRFAAACLLEYTVSETAETGILPCQLVLYTSNGIYVPDTATTTASEVTAE
ncbi:hypothetical protein [Ruminococcus sp.]